MTIYVSNLDLAVTNDELTNLFSAYGSVRSALVSMDGFTDQSRGFAYVEMEEQTEGAEAVQKLDNTLFSSRTISVRAAQPKQEFKGSYRIGTGHVSQK